MEQIRDIVWERVCTNQQEKRESLLDKNRYMERGECAIKKRKEDVLMMANKLKRKQVTFEQLSQLKEIFLQDKNNVNAFLEVDGALDVLVKALSGQNSKLQICAAHCLCNLSLGEKYMRITKIAGPYLVVHLEGMNTYLIEACAWTLGNLSSHNKKCVTLLKKQGALPALTRLSYHRDDAVKVAAAHALSHFVFTGYDVLKSRDFEELIDPALSLFRTDHPSSAYLMSILSGNANCRLKLLREGIHVRSLKCLICRVSENVLNCVWHVRIIGNLVTETSGQAAVEILSHRESVDGRRDEMKSLVDVIEYIMRSGQIFLMRECCWLLGNLLNHNNEDVFNSVVESRVLDKISNPIRYLLMKPGKFGNVGNGGEMKDE